MEGAEDKGARSTSLFAWASLVWHRVRSVPEFQLAGFSDAINDGRFKEKPILDQHFHQHKMDGNLVIVLSNSPNWRVI